MQKNNYLFKGGEDFLMMDLGINASQEQLC